MENAKLTVAVNPQIYCNILVNTYKELSEIQNYKNLLKLNIVLADMGLKTIYLMDL